MKWLEISVEWDFDGPGGWCWILNLDTDPRQVGRADTAEEALAAALDCLERLRATT